MALGHDEAEEIMRLMRRLSMAQRGRKVEMLRALDLQPGQDVVLMEVGAMGSTSQNALAAAAEVDEPSAGRSIARLENKGFLTRTLDPADARRRLVTLTAEGERLIPKIREIYSTIAAEAIGDFEDLAFLKRHLSDIAARLGRPPLPR